MAEHRFPVGPLLQRLERLPTDMLPCTYRTLQRLKQYDSIPLRLADRYAVAIGCHPAELWTEWFDEITNEREHLS